MSLQGNKTRILEYFTERFIPDFEFIVDFERVFISPWEKLIYNDICTTL